jgi:hypothetical protein
MTSIPVTGEYIIPDRWPVSIDFMGRSFIIAGRNSVISTVSYSSDYLIAGRLSQNFEYPDSSNIREIIVTSGRNNVLIPADDRSDTSGILIHYIQTDGSRVLKMPFKERKKK